MFASYIVTAQILPLYPDSLWLYLCIAPSQPEPYSRNAVTHLLILVVGPVSYQSFCGIVCTILWDSIIMKRALLDDLWFRRVVDWTRGYYPSGSNVFHQSRFSLLPTRSQVQHTDKQEKLALYQTTKSTCLKVHGLIPCLLK